MEVAVVENAETGVCFRTNVADFDAREGEVSVVITDRDDKEMGASGSVLTRILGIRKLQNRLDKGMVRLEPVSSVIQQDSAQIFPP